MYIAQVCLGTQEIWKVMLTIFVTLDRDELIDEEFLFGDKELTAKEKAEYRYEHILAAVLVVCIVRVNYWEGGIVVLIFISKSWFDSI